MGNIQKPIPFDSLNVKPPLPARPRLSEDMEQTLALLSGFDGVQRQLVGVSESGVLYSTAPPVKGIVNIIATNPSFNWNGTNIKCSEIMVLNSPKNVGDVWVKLGSIAGPNDGWLLESGDSVVLTIKNLINLFIHITADTEQAILVYSY